jgi:hypothetical protein
MKNAERLRQPNRGGAFHRAEAEWPARGAVVHSVARLLREVEQAVGIVEQQFAGRRQMQTFALTDEQVNAQVALELAHTGGDVRLHAVQLGGRARDAAFLHDRAENTQIAEIHRSLLEINII